MNVDISQERTPVRVLVVDDEPAACEGLSLRLREHEDMMVVGECASAASAFSRIREDPPDLLFLDVEMPGENGLALLERLADDDNLVEALSEMAVILVTAYSQFALDAFRANVVDYLLKPIDDQRFEQALDRVRVLRERIRGQHLARVLQSSLYPEAETEANAAPSAAHRFLVRLQGREVPVDVADVLWIEADGDYAKLHTEDRQYSIRDSIARLERALAAEFGRIHRRALVRFDQVKELRPTAHGDYQIVLYKGDVVKMSRTYSHGFRQRLQGHSTGG